MTRKTLVPVVLCVVAIALAAAIPLTLRYLRDQEVRKAITDYDVALVQALSNLNPDLLGDTVTDRERGRVTSYMTSLWGRGVYVEGDLLEMKVETVTSAEPTVTAIVRERWRYVERDRKNRKQVGSPVTENNHLTYTLVRQNGRLVVHLSEFVEEKKPGEAGK